MNGLTELEQRANDEARHAHRIRTAEDVKKLRAAIREGK